MGQGTLLSDFSDQVASLVARAASSVVQVRGRHGRPATGTVCGAGRVVTAAHVLEHGNGWVVQTAEGDSLAAEVAGADPSTDLAVLRVTGLTPAALPAADRARVGEWAVALGRTWSGALSASPGAVSVVGGPLRTGRGPAIEEVVRADVRPHPLGAGGPLLDARGRVAGIATGVMLRGLPLFIPGAAAWRIADALAAQGRIRRGYLGVSAQPIRVPAGQRAGRPQEVALLVLGTSADSPASRSGLLVGDLIVGFDGHAVQVHEDLLTLLTAERIGKAAPLDVIRGGEPRTLQIEVAEQR
jgi:S1-C subfamily serine protease